MIIGMLNQKGGVGKTTLSVSIAHALALDSPPDSILVVDADPQQSALSWSEMRETPLPFAIVGMAKKSLHRDLPAIAKKYTHVLIDGPPRVTDLARSCIMASDVVVIPCTPSPYDVWASKDTVDLLDEAKVYKERLKGFFAINKKITNTAIGRDVVDALGELGIEVLTKSVSQRVIFAESAVLGKTVFDIEPEGKAAQEIVAITSQILGFELGGDNDSKANTNKKSYEQA